MKNLYLKPFLITGLMLPSLAMAGGLSANSMAQLNGMRTKQSLMNQKNQALGVSVNPVSMRLIEDAVDKLGGKAKVDFGTKIGGVLIGSGADSKGDLAATSNASTGGPIVIEPPFIPQNSITVVGTSKEQTTAVCAYPIAVDEQGNVIRSGSRANQRVCVYSEVPMRLKPGKHLLTYSNTFLMVDLRKEEHLIIPLRQISIPQSNREFNFVVSREACSPTELTKTATALFALQGFEKSLGDTINKLRKEPDCGRERFSKVGDDFFIYNSNLAFIGAMTGSYTFSVLPSVINIEWHIDYQQVLTENISIE